MILTAERLREVLSYDPETGEFRWRVSNSPRAQAGALAGSAASTGYRDIRVDKQLYRSHRLAWLYVHNTWPANEIDHINGDKADNRLTNLREATSSQNKVNQVRLRADNSSGLRGVSWSAANQKWLAKIRHQGQQKNLGYFQTKEQAAEAYALAARDRFGNFYQPIQSCGV